MLAAGTAAAVALAVVLLPFAAAFAAQTRGPFGFPRADKKGVYLKRITFPVAGMVAWSNTYGACRDGCSRRHEGQDIFGKKHQKLVATVDGTVVALRHRKSGNSLYLRSDADGWYYAYLHINNDSPGTNDGRNRYSQAFAPGIALGVHVRRGQHIAYLGDSGNAEGTTPHCHFEMRKPAGSVWNARAVNPKYTLRAASPAPNSSRRISGVRAPGGVPPIRRTDTGRNVLALQSALNYGTGSQLVRDGQFGPATEAALKNLQRWYRLVTDGVYGPRSSRVLQVATSSRA